MRSLPHALRRRLTMSTALGRSWATRQVQAWKRWCTMGGAPEGSFRRVLSCGR